MSSCPNLNNKSIAIEFNSMVSVLGEQLSYGLYDKNNGNTIQKTKDGFDSILYKNLLNTFNGNEEIALKYKAFIYSDKFKSWFGKWGEDNNLNLDEFGEPNVIYNLKTKRFEINKKNTPKASSFKLSEKTIKTSLNELLKKDVKAYNDLESILNDYSNEFTEDLDIDLNEVDDLLGFELNFDKDENVNVTLNGYVLPDVREKFVNQLVSGLLGNILYLISDSNKISINDINNEIYNHLNEYKRALSIYSSYYRKLTTGEKITNPDDLRKLKSIELLIKNIDFIVNNYNVIVNRTNLRLSQILKQNLNIQFDFNNNYLSRIIEKDTDDIIINNEDLYELDVDEVGDRDNQLNDDRVLTLNPKDKLSISTVILLSTIPVGTNYIYSKLLSKHLDNEFFLIYADPDEIHIKLLQELSSNNNKYVEPNFKEYIKILNGLLPYKWRDPLIKKLKNLLPNEKLQFVYSYGFIYNNFKSVLFDVGENYTNITLIDPGNSKAEKRILLDWNSNLLSSKHIKKIDNEENNFTIHFDNDYINELLNDLKLFNNPKIRKDLTEREHAKLILKIFNLFGIYLDTKLINDLINNNTKFHPSINIKNGFIFSDMTNKNNFVYKRITELLNSALKGEINNSTELVNALSNTMFRLLAKLNSEYTNTSNLVSIKDGAKTVTNYSIPRLFYLEFIKIKHIRSYLDKILSTAFSNNSLWGKLLKSNYNKYIEYGTISLQPRNRDGNKYQNKDLHKFNDKEFEETRLLYFLSNFKVNIKKKFKLASYFFSTMSDSKFMPLIKSFRIFMATDYYDYINIPSDNKNGYEKSTVIDFLYSQLVQPEIDRMVYANSDEIDLNGYYSDFFYLIPELNLLDIFDEKNGKRSINLTKVNKNENLIKETLIKHFENEISNTIRFFKENKIGYNEVDNKWYFVDKSNVEYYLSKFEHKDLNDKSKNLKVLDLLVKDYVLNYMVAEANMKMLYQGDPAIFSKGINEEALSDTINDPESFLKNVISTVKNSYKNLTKRLKMYSSPRELHSIKSDSQFINYFPIKDVESPVLSIKYKISIFYPELENNKAELNSEVNEYIKARANSKHPENKKIITNFENKYARIKPYLYTNWADAFEFVHWEHHLILLRDRGVINENVYNELKDAIKANDKLSDRQLSILFSSEKPLYSGKRLINDVLLSPVYIKSSHIPLLPGIAGFDDILKFMDKGINGKKIDRITFESAFKIGMPKNIPNLFNIDGSFNVQLANNINNSKTKYKILKLDSSGYGKQLHVPVKKDNKIIDSTQARKLILLNILNEVVKYKGKSITIRDLENKRLSIYKKILDLDYDNFVSKLTEDSNSSKIDIEKLYNLLMDEIISRGYDLNSHLVVELNNLKNEFKNLPFLNPISKKFEALILSLFSKAGIAKTKRPGVGFVQASSIGNKLSIKSYDDLKNNKKFKNIVFFSDTNYDHNTGLTYDPKTNTAQILIPYIFKKDISLFIDKKTGLIDSNKLPSKFLKLIGYRIPGQGLSSMIALQVVGFLPKSMGNTMVVPAEIVTQMGSDFDIDKLYSYIRAIKITYNKDIYKTIIELKKAIKQVIDLRISKLSDYDDESKETYKKLSKFINNAKKEGLDTLTDEGRDYYDQILELLQEIHIVDKHIKISNKELKKLYDKLNNSYKFEESTNERDVLFNQILDIEFAILQSNNSVIQKHIQSPLDDPMNELIKISDGINKLYNLNKNDLDFEEYTYIPSIVDPSYQKNKYLSGSDGKLGISIFSLELIFQAALQKNNVKVNGGSYIKINDKPSQFNISSIYDIESEKYLQKIYNEHFKIPFSPIQRVIDELSKKFGIPARIVNDSVIKSYLNNEHVQFLKHPRNDIKNFNSDHFKIVRRAYKRFLSNQGEKFAAASIYNNDPFLKKYGTEASYIRFYLETKERNRYYGINLPVKGPEAAKRFRQYVDHDNKAIISENHVYSKLISKGIISGEKFKGYFYLVKGKSKSSFEKTPQLIKLRKKLIEFNKETIKYYGLNPNDNLVEVREVTSEDAYSESVTINYKVLNKINEIRRIHFSKSIDLHNGLIYGIYTGSEILINKEVPVINIETVIHEFLHPFIDDIEKVNNDLFESLYSQALNILSNEEIKLVSKNYDNDNVKKEIIVRAISMIAKDNYDKTTGKLFLTKLKEFFNFIKDKINIILYEKILKNGTITASDLYDKLTIEELSDIVSFHKGSIKTSASENISNDKLKDNKKEKYYSFDDFLSNISISELREKIDDFDESKIKYKTNNIIGYQSASVDNSNIDILGDLNINSHTMSVVIALTRLGFSMKYTMLFINQPIIRAYVKELNKKGVGNETISQVSVVSNLINELIVHTNYEDLSTMIKVEERSMHIVNKLKENILSISNNKLTPDIATNQIKILLLFIKLQNKHSILDRVRKHVNTDSKGIGKNMFLLHNKNKEVIDVIKGELDNDFINASSILTNSIEGLVLNNFFKVYNLLKSNSSIGFDIISHPSGIYTLLEYSFLNYLVTNLNYDINSVYSGEKEYYDKLIQSSLVNLIYLKSLEKLTGKTIQEHKLSILKSKMIESDNGISIESNLGTKIQHLMKGFFENKKLNPSAYNLIKNNAFLKSLQIKTLKVDTDIKLITIDAAKMDELDPNTIHIAIRDLYNKPISLSESYSTRDLVKDLMIYSIITGAIQTPFSINKFIPNELYNSYFGSLNKESIYELSHKIAEVVNVAENEIENSSSNSDINFYNLQLILNNNLYPKLPVSTIIKLFNIKDNGNTLVLKNDASKLKNYTEIKNKIGFLFPIISFKNNVYILSERNTYTSITTYGYKEFLYEYFIDDTNTDSIISVNNKKLNISDININKIPIDENKKDDLEDLLVVDEPSIPNESNVVNDSMLNLNTVDQILNLIISDDSISNGTKKLALAFKNAYESNPLLSLTKPTIKVKSMPDAYGKHTGIGENSTITLSSDLKNKTLSKQYEIFLHENVHNLTKQYLIAFLLQTNNMHELDEIINLSSGAKIAYFSLNLSKDQTEALTRLHKTFSELKNNKSIKEKYPNLNIFEFLAYLANSEFLELIDASNESKSLLKRIYSNIVSLIKSIFFNLNIKLSDLLVADLITVVENKNFYDTEVEYYKSKNKKGEEVFYKVNKFKNKVTSINSYNIVTNVENSLINKDLAYEKLQKLEQLDNIPEPFINDKNEFGISNSKLVEEDKVLVDKFIYKGISMYMITDESGDKSIYYAHDNKEVNKVLKTYILNDIEDNKQELNEEFILNYDKSNVSIDSIIESISNYKINKSNIKFKAVFKTINTRLFILETNIKKLTRESKSIYDTKKLSLINNEIQNLKNKHNLEVKMANAFLKIKNIEDFTSVVINHMLQFDKILNSNNPTASELQYLHSIFNKWNEILKIDNKNIIERDLYLDELPASKRNSLIKLLNALAIKLETEYITKLNEKTRKHIVKSINDKQFENNKNEEKLFDEQYIDINMAAGFMLSADRSNDKLINAASKKIQDIHIQIQKEFSEKSRTLADLINKNRKKLKKLQRKDSEYGLFDFLITDDGRFLHYYSDVFFNASNRASYTLKRDLKHAHSYTGKPHFILKNEAYNRHARWVRNNKMMLDPRFLYPRNKDKSIPNFDELQKKYEDKIISLIGIYEFYKKKEQVKRKVDNYKLELEGYIKELDDNLKNGNITANERKNLIIEFQLKNNPYLAILQHDSLNTIPLFIHNKVEFNPLYNYAILIPRKTFLDNPNKETGYYDESIKKIIDGKNIKDPDLFNLYKYISNILYEMKSYLPEHISKNISIRDIPFYEKSYMETLLKDKKNILKLPKQILKSIKRILSDKVDKHHEDLNQPIVASHNLNNEKNKIINITLSRLFNYYKNKYPDKVKTLDDINSFKKLPIKNEESYYNVFQKIKQQVIEEINSIKSFDLEEVLNKYMLSAISYKYKSENISELSLYNEAITNKLDNSSLLVKSGKVMIDGDKDPITTLSKNNKLVWSNVYSIFRNHNVKYGHFGKIGKSYNKIEKLLLEEYTKIIKHLKSELEKYEKKTDKITEDDALIVEELNQQIKSYEDKIDDLGKEMFLSNFIKLLVNYSTHTGLGWNFKSFLNNAGVGYLVNKQAAADGRIYNEKSFDKISKALFTSSSAMRFGMVVTGYLVGSALMPGGLLLPAIIGGGSGYSISKGLEYLNKKFISKEDYDIVKTLSYINDKYDFLSKVQNESEYLDKDYKNHKSSGIFKYLNKLSPFKSISESEEINQLAVLGSILESTKIKVISNLNKNDINEMSFLDLIMNKKLLSDIYRNLFYIEYANKKIYKEKGYNELLDEKVSVALTYVRSIHGNYSEYFKQFYKNTVYGRAIGQYKGWMWENYANRYENASDDTLLKNTSDNSDYKRKGRYRSLYENLGVSHTMPLVFVASMLPSLAASFIPVIGFYAAPIIGGAIVGSGLYYLNKNLKDVETTNDKKVLGYTYKYLLNRLSRNKLFKDAGINLTMDTELSKEDAANIRATMVESAQGITLMILLLLIMAAKKAAKDRDDDLKLYNGLLNTLGRLNKDISMYSDPGDLNDKYSSIDRLIPSWRLLNDIFDLFRIDKIFKFYTRGKHKGENKWMKELRDITPGINQINSQNTFLDQEYPIFKLK